MTSTQPRHIRVLEAPSRSVEPDAPIGQPSVVTAAGEVNYPLKPPAEWFEDPQLDGPTTLQIDDDGRIYGHVAAWGVRHIGLPGAQTAPRSKSAYRRFRTGNMLCAGGEKVRVGRLTMDTGHAGMNLNADATTRHYDDTGAIIAFCAAGEDAHGIWVAGSLRPDIDPADVVVARGSPLSGDWRAVDGNLELVGALAVVVNGFEIPEPLAQLAASGQPMSLVAAGMIIPDSDEENPMSEQDTDTPETLVAASPFAKNEPAPPDAGDTDDEGSGAAGFEAGDSVLIEGTDMVVQFMGSDDGETCAVDGLPLSVLTQADESMAASAARMFTDRMADRARDAKLGKQGTSIDKLTELVTSLAASAQATGEKVDEMLAKQRADEFDRMVASAGLETAEQPK